MRSLENRYKADVRREFHRTRRILLAETVDRGIHSLPFFLDGYLDEMKANVKSIGSGYVPDIERISYVYLDRQLRGLRKVGADVPRGDVVRLQNSGDVHIQIDRILSGDPAWLDSYRGLVVGSSNLLHAADDQTAGRRLFGENIVDGRASASRVTESRAMMGAGLTFWSGGSAGLGLMYDAVALENRRIKRQVIATIDHKTTDCCLQAHGQIAEMGAMFILGGTPCFNDEMDYTPFHYGCRTSIALYIPEMEGDGIPTSEMLDAANSEIVARAETGERVEIHPSSATSRR